MLFILVFYNLQECKTGALLDQLAPAMLSFLNKHF